MGHQLLDSRGAQGISGGPRGAQESPGGHRTIQGVQESTGLELMIYPWRGSTGSAGCAGCAGCAGSAGSAGFAGSERPRASQYMFLDGINILDGLHRLRRSVNP